MLPILGIYGGAVLSAILALTTAQMDASASLRVPQASARCKSLPFPVSFTTNLKYIGTYIT